MGSAHGPGGGIPDPWLPLQLMQDQGWFMVSLPVTGGPLSSSLADSWFLQDKNSTRFVGHPLSPWLGGIFKATEPFPTQTLPLNLQAVPLREAGSY